MRQIAIYESFTKYWLNGKLQNALNSKHAKTIKPILKEMIPYGLQLEVDYQNLAKELYMQIQDNLRLKIQLSTLESEVKEYQKEILELDKKIEELI